MATANTARIGTYSIERSEPAKVCGGLVEHGQLAEDDQQQHGDGDTADQADRPPPGEPGLVDYDLSERGTRQRSAAAAVCSELMSVLLPC